MFKLVVLSALLALAASKPSGIIAPTVYSSAVIGHAPATISHQSSSIVHSAAIATPVVHAAPIVSTYAAPAVLAAPALSVHPAPLLHHYY